MNVSKLIRNFEAKYYNGGQKNNKNNSLNTLHITINLAKGHKKQNKLQIQALNTNHFNDYSPRYL